MTVAQFPEPPSFGADRNPVTEPDGGARTEAEVQQKLVEARVRLERHVQAGQPATVHYRRETERAFTAEERSRVTILIGGLTARHERLIQAILQACGHRCQPLPIPDLSACLVGKQFGNNGLCNPAYFTVGALVKHLLELEASGLSRQEIVSNYVFFTAGGCGPCRFGMYEGEFRLALRNAGFEGFRILTFQQDDGVKAKTGEAGLQLSLLLGLGAFNAFQVADVMNDFAYAVRPFEVVPGSADRVIAEAMDMLANDLSTRQHLWGNAIFPEWIWRHLRPKKGWRLGVEIPLNLWHQWYGRPMKSIMAACHERLSTIEVDRLRVKPVVKVTGEFWAQSTEGDGNFRMFEFLEREGAQLVVDPLSTWLMYLLRQEHARVVLRKHVDVPRTGPVVARWKARMRDNLSTAQKRFGFWFGNAVYRHRYHQLTRALDDVPHHLIDQEVLAETAHPFYNSLARGGEGHLEVGKTIHYSTQGGAHMVLSLKPFGCMPSTQSDGVQSAVAARIKDVLFLPIETAAEGELHAHSRVQMVLVEAREKAEAEFDRALASTGKKLPDIRRYVDDHPELKSPFLHVPQRPGIAGVAANFVIHVSELIDRDGAWRSKRVVAQPGLRTSANQQTP
jgi:predicted nucleotide-binding protein (sugar kinase/HSP70/actin superfamily)